MTYKECYENIDYLDSDVAFTMTTDEGLVMGLVQFSVKEQAKYCLYLQVKVMIAFRQ